MADLLNTGLQGLDWYQQYQSFGDARDDINEGFDQGREDIKTYQQPYQEFGLQNMQGYQDQGEFSFSNEDFYRDPSYQWRMDESLQQIQRSQAANKMLASTNTLNALTERAGNLASQEYQAAYDRAGDTYDRNLDRYKYGIETGASTAQNMGNNLSQLAVGRGGANAYLEGKKSEAYSNAIKSLTSTGAGGQPGTGGAVGGAIDAAGNWIADQAGGLVDKGLAALGLGGGAAVGDTMLGTGTANQALTWGTGGVDAAMAGAAGSGGTSLGATAAGGAGTTGAGAATYSALSKQVGEQTAQQVVQTAGPEALAGPATNLSFASWAGYATAGVGAIFALRSVVSMLRGDSKYNELMDGLSDSKDPLGDIQNLSSDQLTSGDDRKYHTNLSDSAARGSLYGNILNQMDPQQLAGLKYHQNADSIVKDLLATVESGMEFSEKNYAGAAPTDALKKMFPEIASQIDTMYRGTTSSTRESYADLTSADTNNLMGLAFDTSGYYRDTQAAGDKAAQEVNSYIRQQMGIWRGDRLEAQALEGLV